MDLCCAVLCLVTQSCPTLCDPMNCSPPGSSVHGDSQGKNTGVGIFPTQGSNPELQTDSLPPEPSGMHKNTGVGSPFLLQESKPGFPAFQVDSLPAELPGKPGLMLGAYILVTDVVSVNCPLYQYIMSISVSCYIFWLDAYFV